MARRNPRNRASHLSRQSLRDDAEAIFDEVDTIALHPVDTVSTLPASPETPVFHVENELDAFGREQTDLWTAEAESARRPVLAAEAGLAPAATAAQFIQSHDLGLVEDACTYYRNAQQALLPVVRRKPGQKIWFLVRTCALLAGDISGLAVAAIMYGDPAELAIAQAFSASVATVTAGLIGAEYRDTRLAQWRQRPFEQLTELQQPYAHLFAPNTSGTRTVRIVTSVAVVIGCLIAGGIAALRGSVEGPVGGLVYAGLAGGIAAASFVSSYVVTDPAADVIDNAEKYYRHALKRQPKLAAASVLREHLRAGATVASLSTEYTARGNAAQTTFEGLKHRTLRLNPGVAGHGPAPHEPTVSTPPTVGRRPRQGVR